MKNLGLGVLFCGFSFFGISQEFSYGNIYVESASFSGGNLLIRKDDGSGDYSSTPHYSTSFTDQKPIAYASGNAPTITANFIFECDNAPDSITVRGIAPDGLTFPATKVPLNLVGGSVHSFTYPTTSADDVFTAAESRYFETYKIGWDVSFDDGSEWRAADSTSNTMYVTHTNPMSEGSDFKYWRTIYDISCRNTDGLSTESDIIAGIWSDFTDQVMLTWNGDSLHYYNPMYTFNTSLAALLEFHNAQCYTYAKLFLASIKIQGIVRTNNYVYITPIGNTVCGNTVNRFLVKNWDFSTPSASGECPAFPYKNTYTTLLPYPYTSYAFDTEDVSDMAGIDGQNSPNPSSYFNNHQICYIDGVYYDPSYGVSFATFDDIAPTAFDGWGYRYTSGWTKHCLFTDDLSLSELISSVTTY